MPADDGQARSVSDADCDMRYFRWRLSRRYAADYRMTSSGTGYGSTGVIGEDGEHSLTLHDLRSFILSPAGSFCKTGIISSYCRHRDTATTNHKAAQATLYAPTDLVTRSREPPTRISHRKPVTNLA